MTKINATGTAFEYSTFLGGSAGDIAFCLAADAAGSAYVAGQTFSSDFPMASPLQTENRGGNDGFVAKLAVDLEPAVPIPALDAEALLLFAVMLSAAGLSHLGRR